MRTLGAAALLATLALSGWGQQRSNAPPVRLVSRGTRGAVAAGTEYATEAGMRMLVGGGNAVDAGIATMLAASVCEFSHFGLGGESPILVRTKDGKMHAIAGVGTMPKLASADFFRNHVLTPLEIVDPPEGHGLKNWVPVAGILSALVPGMVEAALVTLRDFGTKSFGEAIEPATELADGFPLDEFRSRSIRASLKYLEAWPSSKRVYLANGPMPRAGEIFRQPDLARTLRSMVAVEKQALAGGATRQKAIDAVRDYFYRGEIAHKIDEFSRQNNGLLRYDDLAAFRIEPEDAVCTNFHGYTVCKPGFWSQGPAMIETLNILEGYNLAEMKQNSTEYIHTLVEALKLAYADRDTYYGDPRFVKIPERLLSKDYAAERRKQIGHDASLEFRPGDVEPNPPKHPFYASITRYKIDDALMAKDTTSVDAVDKDGVAISITPSGAWMPAVIAGDTGIPLTERAQSFLLVPGHPNELAGGKRPRVTLSPTLAVAPDGKSVIALSTPGGDNQDQSLLQVLFNNIEFNQNCQWAVETPRFQTEHLVSSFDNHAMNPGSLLLDERLPAAVVEELKARKHLVEIKTKYESGAAPVIVRLYPTGLIEAGADPFYFRAAQAW
ncbi:MAG TPA: gamma-glutamyltransferase family protein [Bryobacteraceae bacterium]|nr:gamma-glutamyltransferase family protein [Bryobacteraceae bacterium]